MLKLKPIPLAVIILLSVSLACAAPAIATPDPSLAGTNVASTVYAALTQTAQALPHTPTATELPTLTPTTTLSPTPAFTSTPLVSQVSVSVATNCRVGPGKEFDRVGALMVGEAAEVFGVDATWTYWYIRNPDMSPEYCWLWNEYATVTGDLLAIPVFTPQPTPTPAPAFEVSYHGLEHCADWWVDIQLKNTGAQSFKSVVVTLRDTTNDTVVSKSADSFVDDNGCSGSSEKDVLNFGDTRMVSSPTFNYDPKGHKIDATVTLCANKGISGLCVTQKLTFTP